MQDSRTDCFYYPPHYWKEPNEMNGKIANVIALELGILIAIMAWLAFSNLSRVRPPRVAEEQERTAGSFATLTQVPKARSQRLSAVDYRAGGGAGQPQDEEPAQTVQQYDQQIATAPYASSDLYDDSPYANSDLYDDVATESSPYYAGVDQEPLVYPPDCLVSPLDQIVVYPQPNEIIIFSNTRSFGNRRRSTGRFGSGGTTVANRRPGGGEFGGPRMMVAHRRPGGRDFRAPAGGLIPSRNAHARPSRPAQGIQASPRSLARK
jgi:hypothetical protein